MLERHSPASKWEKTMRSFVSSMFAVAIVGHLLLGCNTADEKNRSFSNTRPIEISSVSSSTQSTGDNQARFDQSQFDKATFGGQANLIEVVADAPINENVWKSEGQVVMKFTIKNFGGRELPITSMIFEKKSNPAYVYYNSGSAVLIRDGKEVGRTDNLTSVGGPGNFWTLNPDTIRPGEKANYTLVVDTSKMDWEGDLASIQWKLSMVNFLPPDKGEAMSNVLIYHK